MTSVGMVSVGVVSVGVVSVGVVEGCFGLKCWPNISASLWELRVPWLPGEGGGGVSECDMCRT